MDASTVGLKSSQSNIMKLQPYANGIDRPRGNAFSLAIKPQPARISLFAALLLPTSAHIGGRHPEPYRGYPDRHSPPRNRHSRADCYLIASHRRRCDLTPFCDLSR
jgi:hypothetical protein